MVITGNHEDHGRVTLRREAGVFTIEAEELGFVRGAFAPMEMADWPAASSRLSAFAASGNLLKPRAGLSRGAWAEVRRPSYRSSAFQCGAPPICQHDGGTRAARLARSCPGMVAGR